MEALKTAKSFWPLVTFEEPTDEKVETRRMSLSTLQSEIAYYEAVVADCQEQLQRVGVM